MSIQHSFYPVEAEKKGATPSQVQKYLPRMLFRIYYVINLFRPSDPCKTFSFKESRLRNQGFWSLLTACSHVFKMISDLGSEGQEVKFHEIEIAIFHEIEITIMRSKLCLFMRSNLFINIWQCRSWGGHFNHEVKIP